MTREAAQTRFSRTEAGAAVSVDRMLPRGMLERCAANFPDKAAYLCGERGSTWREMSVRSDALAIALQGLGVAKGDVVGVLGEESIEIYESLFACMKIGAIRVGLNWRHPVSQLRHILRDAGVRLLLVQDRCIHLIRPLRAELGALGIRLLGYGPSHDAELDYEGILRPALGHPLEAPHPEGGDALLYSYTSGATGNAKGVIISHRAAATAILSGALGRGLVHDDVHYLPAQSSWVIILMNLFGLATGMTHAIPDGVFEIRQCLRDLERLRVTVVLMVPTMIKRALAEYRAGAYDLSSLRMIMYGSAPASPAFAKEIHETFGCDLAQTYGMTETAGGISHLSPGDHRLALAGEPQLLNSVGRPTILFSVSIRDEDGRALPAGEVGEIWVRGDAVMTAYLNDPRETAEALVGGWLRTNDIGRLDGRGYLYLVDRRKYVIKSGGVKVFSAGVESVLGRHPSVEEACVLGMPHATWGEAVVAVLKLRPGVREPSIDELTRHCNVYLSKPECPKAFVFVDELARTATGKVAKEAAREWLSAHAHLLSWPGQPEESLQ